MSDKNPAWREIAEAEGLHVADTQPFLAPAVPAAADQVRQVLKEAIESIRPGARLRPFGHFSNAEIDQVARAFGSAANESESVNDDLAADLAAEFKHRGRKVPLPYEWGDTDPDVWWSRIA